MLLITSNDSHRDSTCVDNKRYPEKTERSIKNKQSADTANIGHNTQNSDNENNKKVINSTNINKTNIN
jgi:hypothetical protein